MSDKCHINGGPLYAESKTQVFATDSHCHLIEHVKLHAVLLLRNNTLITPIRYDTPITGNICTYANKGTVFLVFFLHLAFLCSPVGELPRCLLKKMWHTSAYFPPSSHFCMAMCSQYPVVVECPQSSLAHDRGQCPTAAANIIAKYYNHVKRTDKALTSGCTTKQRT